MRKAGKQMLKTTQGLILSVLPEKAGHLCFFFNIIIATPDRSTKITNYQVAIKYSPKIFQVEKNRK